MTRTHGRCARGRRLIAKAPHGHWRTLTFLAALRHDRIGAPCVFDGPINGRSFLAYVEQCLVPELSPGDIVIMDNLGSHKSQAVRRAIRRTGAKLFFLPPPTAPISIPSSRSSPSSKPCSARLPSEPSRQPGSGSANSSTTSLQPSAPTTSLTLDTLQNETIAF
jgi:DDE superfamily endonuclease